MLTQKITFTPVDNYKLTNKARSKKASQVNVSTPEYSSIDYSKIAFGAMYGVKPKKMRKNLSYYGGLLSFCKRKNRTLMLLK